MSRCRFSVCCAMLLGLVGCQGCSDGSSRPDSFPSDTCSLPLLEPLPEPTASANVASDLRLDISDMNTGSGAIALFYENNRLALFAPKIFHDVDLQGNVLASTPYQGPRPGSPTAFSVRGEIDRRTIVLTGGDLCLVSPDGSVDVPSCQAIYENDSLLVPSAWTPGGLAALSKGAPGTVMHARVFDQDLTLLREKDMWTNTTPTFHFGPRGGMSSTTSRYVVCGGAPHDWYEPGQDSCASSGLSTFTSSLDSAEIQHTDLLPLGTRAVPTCMALSSGDRVVLLYGATCYTLDEWGNCDPTVAGQNYMSIVDDDGTLLSTKPVAMKIGLIDKFLWDGTRFVYFAMSTQRVVVWVFDRDGNFVLENVRLPLSSESPGTSLLNDMAVAKIGVNDYVMVYGAYPPSGFETRMARFSLPAP